MEERPSYRLPRNVLPEHYALVLMPDLDHAAFDGEVIVDIRVVEPANEVVLNAAELDIVEAHFAQDGQDDVPATVSYLADEEQAVLVPARPLEPGAYSLFMRFSGQLNDLLRGFYRSKFKRDNGEEAWLAATQFEATDARRAFPCWDEPDLKASFGVTIVADEALTVLSNARRGLFRTARQRQTSGPLCRHHKDVDVPGGVRDRAVRADAPRGTWTACLCASSRVPGRGALTGLAGDAAAHALSVPPGVLRRCRTRATSSTTSASRTSLQGPWKTWALSPTGKRLCSVSEQSSQDERRRVVSVIGHETAHMWFGDLVTMRWWDGTWLNEAFATYMELLVTDTFEPRWQIWSNFGIDQAAALATDGLRATRAIEFPVGRPDEVQDMFDVITYDKGAAVLRMIERHLGEENFRRGLQLLPRQAPLLEHRYHGPLGCPRGGIRSTGQGHDGDLGGPGRAPTRIGRARGRTALSSRSRSGASCWTGAPTTTSAGWSP